MNKPNTPLRGKWQGAAQIWKFNWPLYVIGALVGVGGWLGARRVRPKYLQAALKAGGAASWWFTIGSFAISHWIYDRSPLCRWNWVENEVGPTARGAAFRWGNFHAGLDESTPALRAIFPESSGAAYDFFDAQVMTEPSIRRARALCVVPEAPQIVDFRALELPDKYLRAAFVFFAAHELREREQRLQFLRELQRVLEPNSTLILAEHARDAANFVAFGPGFLHFFAARQWRELLGEAGFEIVRESRITSFVRIWTCRR